MEWEEGGWSGEGEHCQVLFTVRKILKAPIPYYKAKEASV